MALGKPLMKIVIPEKACVEILKIFTPEAHLLPLYPWPIDPVDFLATTH